MTKLKLRCYVCGKDIDYKELALVSAGKVEVDRVFVVHTGDCLADVQEDQPTLVVHGSKEGCR